MANADGYCVLGIDPGLNVTGYGAVRFGAGEPKIVEAGAIRTSDKDPLPRRITQIHADVADLLTDLQPDAVAVEQLYAHYKHPRTSILMAHARGTILLAAQQAGVAIHNLPATKIKKSITGNGHASKQQMQRAIQTLCNLDAPPEPPDVADALAIALCAGKLLAGSK